MSGRSGFDTWRMAGFIASLWRAAARGAANMLPKGLYARSLLIVIMPMVLLQTLVAYVFMQRHFDIVTHRLSAGVARDVAAIVDLYRELPKGADDQRLRAIARTRFQISAELTPPQALPPPAPKSFLDMLDPLNRSLPSELREVISTPFWVDPVGRSGLVEIRVDLGHAVLRMFTRRSLAYEPNAHIFIVWMVGASFALITVAILFLRNQIRPILRLASAAEEFGKGRDFDFLPRGAREVRQAGYAFAEMKRRIERATEQRTAMLNGVSHDLRTILTRFRLSVEMMDETPERELLLADVEEMLAMLEGYLAFARGDAGEPTSLTNLRSLLEDLRLGSERHGAPVSLETKGDLNIRVRPLAVKRCIGNLITNAQRHGAAVQVLAAREQRFAVVHVDDDGPGIAQEHREDVFRPFLRLDESRNQDEGGSGLGLAIARDVARSHGGDISLASSPLGGLRATVRLPL